MNYNDFNVLLNNNNISLFDAQSRVVHYRLNNYLKKGYTLNKMNQSRLKLLVESLLDNYESRINYLLSLE